MRERNRKPPTQGDLSMAQFAQGVSDGAFTALDRFGNRITRGALVLYRPDMDVVYQVKEVVPVMDPRLPQRMVRLTLDAMVPLTVMVGAMVPNLLFLGRGPGDNGRPTLTAGGIADLSAEAPGEADIEPQTPPADGVPPDQGPAPPAGEEWPCVACGAAIGQPHLTTCPHAPAPPQTPGGSTDEPSN